MTDIPKLEDLDPVETQEWLESIDSVLKAHGDLCFAFDRIIGTAGNGPEDAA